MNRKLDWSTLLLFTALLFGAVVRFWPAITNGFPLNDGGMFYTMIRDLKANHFILPQFTSYNHADIPFAYPPLGFYVAASFSALLHVSELQVLLWLPALANTISIFIFYKLAEQVLPTRIIAALAVMIYALSSTSLPLAGHGRRNHPRIWNLVPASLVMAGCSIIQRIHS